MSSSCRVIIDDEPLKEGVLRIPPFRLQLQRQKQVVINEQPTEEEENEATRAAAVCINGGGAGRTPPAAAVADNVERFRRVSCGEKSAKNANAELRRCRSEVVAQSTSDNAEPATPSAAAAADEQPKSPPAVVAQSALTAKDKIQALIQFHSHFFNANHLQMPKITNISQTSKGKFLKYFP